MKLTKSIHVPMMETLEDRRLYAAGGAMIDGEGVLQIRGTQKNDTIVVAINANDSEMVDVTINGKTTTLDSFDIGEIFVDAKQGNDVVHIDAELEIDATVLGGAGSDVITGGAGNDSLVGGVGKDSLDGGEGDDFLLGQQGDDVLHGGAGDDVLLGDVGKDQLDGGDDDDVLNGGLGKDNITGGDGADSFCVADRPNERLDFNADDDEVLSLVDMKQLVEDMTF